MDELVRYGPWVISGIALLLAWSATAASSRARARVDLLERGLAAQVPPRAAASSTPAEPAASPESPPRTTAFEVRLGALEERIAKLAARVDYAAQPDPDDVTPMRPPAPTTVEPLPAPRAGWRMFP